MFKFLLAWILLSSPALGETLLSGAVYFDSENTLHEVQELIKAGDTDNLARLFKGNHISEKIAANQDVILLFAGVDAVEFRFANNPTTYWTYPKWINVNVPRPAVVATPSPTASLSPAPNSTLPGDLPSSLASAAVHLPEAMPTPTAKPTPAPTATPMPTATPKPQVAAAPRREEENAPVKREERGEDAGIVWHTVNGHRKWYSKRHPPAKPLKEESDEEEVPEWAKVWHIVNGRRKWYDKRNYHEVRKALPVDGVPIAGTPVPANVPTAAPIPVQGAVSRATPYPYPTPYPNAAPRAVPVRPVGQ